MLNLFRRMPRPLGPERLVWLLLGVAAAVHGYGLVTWLPTLPARFALTSAPEPQVQRIVNGPLVSYARELRTILPAESCLQLIHPDVGPNRREGRDWYVPSAYVLGHNLYPHQVRLAADAAEALAAPGCDGQPGYALVWIEPQYPQTAAALDQELARLRVASGVLPVSDYVDRDGNTGHTFAIRRY
jgi:hypothetical protein